MNFNGGSRGWPISKKLYALILTLIGILGIALISVSAWHKSSAEGSSVERVINDVQQQIPELKAVDENRLKADLNFWEQHGRREPLRDVLLRDLGIALLVAVLLSVVIESYARNRLQDEMRSGIIEAAFARLIPHPIFEQVRAHVIGATLFKESFTVEMVLREDAKACEGRPGHYVSHTIIRSQLRSLTGKEIREKIGMGLDRDVTSCADKTAQLPRFESVTIGDKVFSGKELAEHLHDDGHTFRKDSIIGAAPVPVTFVVEEIVRVPDTFVWSTRHCSAGGTIIIDSSGVPGVKFEVTALHPEASSLVERVSGRNWELNVAMLPWQGFQVRSWQVDSIKTPEVV